MAKSWFKRFWDYLGEYDKKTPTLVVVTPVVHSDPPPEPFTIVVPAGKVAAALRRKAAKQKSKNR
jgi:hypothetical protein